jgi:8-oxo-dGTP pyrophosphatase MutT (NUDIX family)
LRPDSATDLAALEAAISGRRASRRSFPRARAEAGGGPFALEGRIPAAVCVPLHGGARGLEVWAIKRVAGLRHHAREIAFPGGKPDPGDRDLADTALRETEEELGIARASLRILGALTPVPTATSRFTLNPFVVRVEEGAKAVPDAGEVAAVIRMPVGDFFAGRVPFRAVELGPGRRSPIFDFEVGSMYGASAHVLEELLLIVAELKGLRFPEPALTDQIPWQ